MSRPGKERPTCQKVMPGPCQPPPAIDALVLLGPTACGKTALAHRLADEWNLEIISLDAAHGYQGLDIGSAKPTFEE